MKGLTWPWGFSPRSLSLPVGGCRRRLAGVPHPHGVDGFSAPHVLPKQDVLISSPALSVEPQKVGDHRGVAEPGPSS